MWNKDDMYLRYKIREGSKKWWFRSFRCVKIWIVYIEQILMTFVEITTINKVSKKNKIQTFCTSFYGIKSGWCTFAMNPFPPPSWVKLGIIFSNMSAYPLEEKKGNFITIITVIVTQSSSSSSSEEKSKIFFHRNLCSCIIFKEVAISFLKINCHIFLTSNNCKSWETFYVWILHF